MALLRVVVYCSNLSLAFMCELQRRENVDHNIRAHKETGRVVESTH
jgi:hypothetical protein